MTIPLFCYKLFKSSEVLSGFIVGGQLVLSSETGKGNRSRPDIWLASCSAPIRGAPLRKAALIGTDPSAIGWILVDPLRHAGGDERHQGAACHGKPLTNIRHDLKLLFNPRGGPHLPRVGVSGKIGLPFSKLRLHGRESCFRRQKPAGRPVSHH